MNKLVIFLASITFLLSNCKKTSQPSSPAALNLINAVVGSQPLVTDFAGSDSIGFSIANQLAYGYYSGYTNEFTEVPGIVQLGLFQYPDTTTQISPLYNLTLKLTSGSIYSLFLAGSVSLPDTMLVTDILPYYPNADSVVGIRFVNLSAGSNPVSVNMIGSVLGSEIKSLPYKGISSFHTYLATAEINSYTFEFHDISSGALLANYTLQDMNSGLGPNATSGNDNYLFNNFTLALIGSPDSTGTYAQTCVLINDF